MNTHDRNEDMNWQDDPRLSAYVLGELDGSELATFEAELRENAELRAEVQAMQGVADMLHKELATEAVGLSDAQRGAIVSQARLAEQPRASWAQNWMQRLAWIGVAAVSTAAGTLLYVGWDSPSAHTVSDELARQGSAGYADNNLRSLQDLGYGGSSVERDLKALGYSGDSNSTPPPSPGALEDNREVVRKSLTELQEDLVEQTKNDPTYLWKKTSGKEQAVQLEDNLRSDERFLIDGPLYDSDAIDDYRGPGDSKAPGGAGAEQAQLGVYVQTPQTTTVVASQPPTPGLVTGAEAKKLGQPAASDGFFLGRGAKPSGQPQVQNRAFAVQPPSNKEAYRRNWAKSMSELKLEAISLKDDIEDLSRESYAHVHENEFVRVSDDSLSTFSIDVDTAAYANVRRFLNEGRIPPADAVRIEELINYFSYDYAAPEGTDPFAVHLEVAKAPWKKEHMLLRVGLKGREINDLPKRPKNLTFLVDVSGSMQPENKLPLLKRAMRLLVDNLDPKDKVAIVVYAGAAGMVLPPTLCSEKPAILQSLERLQSGGSTAGAAGIELAYRTAQENFVEGGVNRVILATDGDFNVGISDEGSLVRLIEEKREHGVFLSVLGFGTGNLQDSKMEKLANKGNGNYAYIDTLKEAHKVLVRELGGTLETIAKDVKIQIEFNPREVAGFRLIGYENRKLAHTDFNDDTKDAGEIGAGHTVTALYELIPHGAPMARPAIDPLKYQEPERQPEGSAFSGELFTVKLRYKEPQGSTSKLIERSLKKGASDFEEASEDFRFAASVAAFGMILRGSQHCGDLGLEDVMGLTAAAAGADAFGYRSEFLSLLDKADRLTRR